MFPKFSAPVSGKLREVIENATTARDKISLKWLGVTKGESGGVAMMKKTVKEVAQYDTVFNYVNPKTIEQSKLPIYNDSDGYRG